MDLDHATMFARSRRRGQASAWRARSRLGTVATAHYLASEAGARMLRQGGNAVDAAVAAALTLAVVEPAGSGLGGNGFALLHLAGSGETLSVEAPCRAPAAATPEAVAAGPRYRGHRAVAIPTNPALLGWLHATHGRLSRQALFEPAVELASEGFPLSPLQAELTNTYRDALARGRAAELLLGPGARPLVTGHPLRQPALARTLRRMSEQGFEEFYRGESARLLCVDMQAGGGFLGAVDLDPIPWPRVKPPLVSHAFGWRVHTVGPPAGGATLVQLLNMLHAARRQGLEVDPDSERGVVLLAAIIRQARRERRSTRLKIGSEELAEARSLVRMSRARRALERARATLAGETTHLCALDAEGNAVALTQSIERSFGAAEYCPELGYLYNGFLRGFKVLNRRHPHFLRPGAPARSNAAPTLVLRKQRLWGALGATGSERANSAIVEVLLRLKLGASGFEAVAAPRLHCTPEAVVLAESERMPPASLAALRRAGFTLESLGPYAFKAGGLQLALRHRSGVCEGVADPRRDGSAAPRD